MSSSLPQPRPFPSRELWLFFFIALLLKLVFFLTVRDSPFVTELTNDEWHHWQVALEILSSGLIRPDAFYFAPLYQYFLAGIFAITGPHLTLALMVNILLGAATVALTFALTFVLTGQRRAARIASTLTLLFAPLYLYEVLLLKTTAAATLSVAALLALMVARRRDRWTQWLASGLAFGLLSLLRGNTLLVLPIVVLTLIVDHLGGRLPTRSLLLWMIGIAIGILPATAHNIVAGSDLVLTTFQGGSQFWIGNHHGATGTYTPLRPGRGLPDQERFDAISLAEQASGRALFPSEVSKYWLDRGMSFVVQEPINWMVLMGHKMRLVLSNDEIADVVHLKVFEDYEPQLRAAFLPFGLIAAMAAAGIWLRRKSWRWDLPVWATVGASLFSVVLFFVFGRYRTPIAPLLAVLAGAGLDGLMVIAKEGRRRQAIVPLLLISGVAMAAMLPANEASPLVSYNTLGGLYLRQGHAEAAAACFEKVVNAAPDNPLLRMNLALALESLGDPCGAAQERSTVDNKWKKEIMSNGDLVFLIQYLDNADRLRKLSIQCPNFNVNSDLSTHMTWVARTLEARHRAGLFTPSAEVEKLISRSTRAETLQNTEIH